MITKAYRALQSLRASGGITGSFPQKTFKDVNGVDRTIDTSGAMNSSYVNNAPNGSVNSNVYYDGGLSPHEIGIYIGTGTTPATEDDYKLEAPLTKASLTHSGVIPEAILDDQNNIIGVRRIVTYMNNTMSAISVSEMGTYMRAYYGTGGFPADFLIERTVLSTPVVLEPWQLIRVAFDMLY
jgi:hypothetical protein